MDTTTERVRQRNLPQPIDHRQVREPSGNPQTKLLLVGGIPRPVGGVTQHVWRLASQLRGLGTEVLDVYPGPKKYPLPQVRVRTAPRQSLLQPFWFFRQIWQTPAETIHFHFSTVRHISLLERALKTVSRGRRHVLTLHHGQLMLGWNELNSRQQRAAVRGLNAFDQIISLSSQQTEFYQNIGRVPEEKLQLGTSYIPLTDSLLQSLDCASDPLSQPPGIPSDARILVASGYPEEIYQHELCLQTLSALKQSFPVHLVMCLYGSPRTQTYLNQLLSQCDRSDVTVLWDLDFAEFTSIIRRAALYLRPTQVDSFGLAVADAINAGVPAVASAVCQRYPGAFLIDPHQPEEFTEVCRRVLTGETEGLPQEVRHLPPGCDERYLTQWEKPSLETASPRPLMSVREHV